MYAAIELFRAPMTDQLPNGVFMAISLTSGLLLLLVGLTYFKMTEDFFADFA